MTGSGPLRRELDSQVARLSAARDELVHLAGTGERYRAAGRLLTLVGDDARADVMRTVTDEHASADERRALVELARIGTVVRDALEIIDALLAGQNGPGSVDEWKARVEQFPFEMKRPLVSRWVVYALERGLDPAVHNPEVLDAFLRYKPGTTERYAEGTRAAYGSHLSEWFRWLNSDPANSPAGR